MEEPHDFHTLAANVGMDDRVWVQEAGGPFSTLRVKPAGLPSSAYIMPELRLLVKFQAWLMQSKGRQKDMGNLRVRILIAEDNPSIAAVMKLALNRQGWQVEVVEDGLAAVERALAEEYDLILMDHRMPRCSGAEAARRILAARPGQRIAMVTGTPTNKEFRQIIEKNMLCWLVKPFGLQELVDAVQGWLERA